MATDPPGDRDDAQKPPLIFLMGPTASGKTGLALGLAQQLPLEIINVDSSLVYRGLDIGSAKPSAAEMQRVPHHLIDIRDPAEPYSAAEFRRDALEAIAAIQSRGRIPLLVGGTMLYFKLLREGMAELPAADSQLRAQLEDRANREGWPALHRELAAVDPQTAARLHPNHSQRILRALEIYHCSGQTMSALLAKQNATGENPLADQRLIQLALLPHDRALLHQRIERRFQAMLNQGFEDEVRVLYARGDLSPALPAIRAVGYRQMWAFLEGQVQRQEMIGQALAATRQLAKRQLTWLRGWRGAHTVYIDDLSGKELSSAEIQLKTLNYLEGITI